MLKENLDKRICDCEEATSTVTYREFIRESEEEFKIDKADIDNMSNEKLEEYLNWLDYLWEK